jgi:hypothetical protein
VLYCVLRHPGATAALIAIVEGFMGVRPLEPGYASFVVQPQPGAVLSASIRVPTLRGFIHVSFAQQTGLGSDGSARSMELNVSIPANTKADVCIPATHEAREVSANDVLVDGVRTPAVRRGGYLCAVGLGAAAVPRRVSPATTTSARSPKSVYLLTPDVIDEEHTTMVRRLGHLTKDQQPIIRQV